MKPIYEVFGKLALLTVQTFFTSIFGLIYIVCWTFARVFLCPFGYHVTGWRLQSSHSEGDKLVVYRDREWCAFCEHEKDMLK